MSQNVDGLSRVLVSYSVVLKEPQRLLKLWWDTEDFEHEPQSNSGLWICEEANNFWFKHLFFFPQHELMNTKLHSFIKAEIDTLIMMNQLLNIMAN